MPLRLGYWLLVAVYRQGRCAIRRRFLFTSLFLALLSIMVLSGCRRGGAGGPTPQPTATYTPRSTPLPALTATPIPGSVDSPIRLLIVQPDGVRGATLGGATEELQNAINEQLGLIFEVELVDSSADAVRQMCDAASGIPVLAWLDGMAYATTKMLDCGYDLLQLERDSEEPFGETIQIIVNDGAGINSVSDLVDSTFCRLSYDDRMTWLLPSLLMQANGVDPTTELEAVNNFEDMDALLEAVDQGDCQAAGVSATYFANLQPGRRRNIEVLNDTITVPYGILVASAQVPLGDRDAIQRNLPTLEAGEWLEALLGADMISEIDPDSLENWVNVLESTGIDFAAFARP